MKKPVRTRPVCPDCAKKGLGPWKWDDYALASFRECRYCGRTERRGMDEIRAGLIHGREARRDPR